MTREISIDSILNNLNEQQREVVYSSDRQLLCLAGAGTGKTYTLISKILYTTEVLNEDPSNILALTFTNAAGHEMQKRFEEHSQASSSPYFGTFHSFCYKLLCENKNIRTHLGYSDVPSIIDESQEKNLFSKAKLITNTKLPKYAYSIQYVPKPKEKFEYEVFQKTVKKLLRQNNQITFDRLCFEICQMFIENNKLVQEYLHKYSYVYVDEFQDTDPLQWEFVKVFIKSSRVILFGDARQAIYQFRGADNSIIKSLSTDLSWKLVKLETNYRSTKEICEYANKFVENYDDNIPRIALTSTKPGIPVFELLQSQFLSNLKAIETNSAILCRTNAEVSTICNYLTSANVEYHTKQTTELNKLVACALDDNFRREFLLSSLLDEQRTSYMRKMLVEKSYDPLLDLEKQFKNILDEIEEIKQLDEFDSIRMMYENGDLLLSQIDSSIDITQPSSTYVGTIHSVKGLEFDTVYVYGVNSQHFKIMSSEELMNLYYVAITRAKNKLVLINSI